MTTPLLKQQPHYAALLRRWNELDAILYPTYRERVEKRVLGEQVAAIEAEYDRRAGARGEAASPFAAICDDYEETMRWAGDLGDLGGVELV